jgi:hypothetical protein
MTKLAYSEKLKDPRWQRKRLEVLSRDNFSCKICGDETKTLHVHHCGYSNEYKNPWEYPNGWLITLCETCHEDETYCLSSSKKDFIDEMSSIGFTSYDYMYLRDAVYESKKIGMDVGYFMRLVLDYKESLGDDDVQS